MSSVASRSDEPAAFPAGAADLRRIRRLFAVLDDVAHYTADNAGSRMLAHAWDRLSDLLLQSDDPRLRAAVHAVSEQTPGTSGWWASTRAVAAICADRHFALTSGGGRNPGRHQARDGSPPS